MSESKQAQATRAYRLSVIRAFREESDRDELVRVKSHQLRQVVDDLFRENAAHMAPDRALLIQTAATITVAGYNIKDAVQIARELIAEVDK